MNLGKMALRNGKASYAHVSDLSEVLEVCIGGKGHVSATLINKEPIHNQFTSGWEGKS